MNSPRRRALLGAMGSSALWLTTGCLGDGVLDGGSTPDPPGTDSGPGTTPDPRYADDLFLKNETSENRLLDLRVTRDADASSVDAGDADREGDDGEAVVAGRYDVPGSAKLELPNVGAIGDRYAVEARFPGDEWRRFDWLVSDCEEYHTPAEDPERTPAEDRTLNADAVVLLTDDGLDFARNECDGIVVAERGAVPAEEYAVSDGEDSSD